MYNKINIFIIFIILAISSVKIFLPTFNLEWQFLDLANYFNNRSSILDLKTFKIFQANTSFYSLLISQLKFKNFLEEAYFIRAINLVSLPILVFNLNIITDYINKNFFYNNNLIYPHLVFYIIFTPIIFLLLGKAFPDYFSFFFVICSISSYIKNRNFLFIFFLIFATILKPLALYIFPILLIISFLKNKNFYEKKIIFSLFAATLLAILYIYLVDGVLFESGHKNYTKFTLLGSVSNYLMYISYLSVLLLFFIPYKLYYFFQKKKNKKIISYLSLSILSYYMLRNNYGEMNYGFISTLIKSNFANISLYILSILSFLLITDEIIFQRKKPEKYFFFSINISILILAVFVERPAQRYLIYIYPFYLLFFFCYFQSANLKKILILNILCFALINFFQFFYYMNFAEAANKIYKELSDKKILEQTNPLDISHVIGYKFNKNILLGKNLNYKYIVKYCEKKPSTINLVSVYEVKLINFTIKKICILKNDIS